VKKLLLAALLLLTASIAEARQVTTDLLVVKLDSQRIADAVNGPGPDIEQGEWIHQNLIAMLREWDVDYITFNAKALPTGKMEWLRTGRVVVGPDTITASAVLHERMARRAGTFDYPAYRPDSLFMARVVNGTPMLPSVPSLFILEPGPAGAYNTAAIAWNRATSCSIGVNTSTTQVSGGDGVPHECEGCMYSPYTTRVFFPSSAMMAMELDHGTVGGVLPLLAIYTNPVSRAMQELGRMPSDVMKSWAWDDVPDTTGFYGVGYPPFRWSAPDTATVYKRLNIGWNVKDADGGTVPAAQMVVTAMPIAVGTVDGSQNTRDGGGLDYQSVFVALAALDSLLDGGLLNKVKTQAVTIDGAFARCDAQYSYGVYEPDSAAIKATVDSLVAYGIPFLVGANVDSVAAYPYEKAWWMKGGAKFSPQVWSGVHGANGAASYTAGRYTLRDIFGHARARTAYGPADGEAADTTVYAQLKYAFARNDSLFPGRTSRFLLPPLDDYVPTNTVKGDSVLVAAYLAGATGVRIAGSDTLRHAFQMTNVQGDYFGGLKLRAHSGEYVTGGSRIMCVPGGTSYPGSGYFVEDSGYTYHPFCSLNERHQSGLLRGRFNGYQQINAAAGTYANQQFLVYGSSAYPNVPYEAIPAGGPDPNQYHNGWALASRTSIIKASAASLGGSTRLGTQKQPAGEPMRPAWWVIRSADGLARVVNAVAGRTLIRWGYPDQIEP